MATYDSRFNNTQNNLATNPGVRKTLEGFQPLTPLLIPRGESKGPLQQTTSGPGTGSGFVNFDRYFHTNSGAAQQTAQRRVDETESQMKAARGDLARDVSSLYQQDPFFDQADTDDRAYEARDNYQANINDMANRGQTLRPTDTAFDQALIGRTGVGKTDFGALGQRYADDGREVIREAQNLRPSAGPSISVVSEEGVSPSNMVLGQGAARARLGLSRRFEDPEDDVYRAFRERWA